MTGSERERGAHGSERWRNEHEQGYGESSGTQEERAPGEAQPRGLCCSVTLHLLAPNLTCSSEQRENQARGARLCPQQSSLSAAAPWSVLEYHSSTGQASGLVSDFPEST